MKEFLKFVKDKIERNLSTEEIIILDNNNSVINKHYVNLNTYCLRYLNKEYLLYVSNNLVNECELIKN